MKKVSVLDHGMGNLRSVGKALETAGATVSVTSDLDEIERSDALCVPGQGIFGRCVDNLAQRGGEDLIRRWVGSERPFLGICLGMQVLFDASEEGDHKGLGVIPGQVKRLTGPVTVPHIGWNEVESVRRPSPSHVESVRRPSPSHVESGSGSGDTFYYFDHSFAVYPDDPACVTGWCEHGTRFAARVEMGSILGVQFHPEKSGSDGISLLEEWISD